MKAEIISVGNEVLSGIVANTDTAFLARQLALMGFEVHRQSVVGDVEAEIVEAVIAASRRSHVTILSGGLGPTRDDLTKESVAKAFGLGLEHDPVVESQIRRFFEERDRVMPQSNLKQALVIKGGEVLENINGTAPGIYLQTSTQAIVLLPGPAGELEPLFLNEVKPRLEKLSRIRSAGVSLHVFGIGESALEEQVQDLLYGENPSAALYAKPCEVHIELLARANTEADAKAALDRQVARFKERVGEYIYSDDGSSLAATVVQMLTQSRTRLAIAESCTGGLMAARITEIPGASRVFDYGIAAYSDETKQKSLNIDIGILRKFSAISSATAAEMAKSARLKGGADIGVGITGVAGPVSDFINKPVGLVYIAVADKHQVIVKKFNFGTTRERTAIRELCVFHALDMVRRFLLGLEIEDSRAFEPPYLADLEHEGRPRKKSAIAARRIATQCFMIALILVGAGLCINAVNLHARRSVYNRLRASYAKHGDLTAIKAENPDTVGWLKIEESGSVNTVVVANPDEDGFYQTHDFSGAANSLGCLYVDPGSNIDSGDNIVIHGTSVDRTQMFGPLLGFTDPQRVADGNAEITLNRLSGSSRFRVVSIFYANANPDKGDVQNFYLTSSLNNISSVFADFVVQLKMRSVMNVDVDIVSGDQFLTLVTDAPDWQGAKLVVIARRVRNAENVVTTAAMFSYNLAATYPSEWYVLRHSALSSVNEKIEREKWLNWLLNNERNLGNDKWNPNPGEIKISVYLNDKLLNDTPLNIVSRVVAGETAVFDKPEAIKAVAIAIIGTICNAYSNGAIPSLKGIEGEPIPYIKNNVADVINMAAYYNDKFAYTPYFISCPNQKTYNATDVFGADFASFPYLKSVESLESPRAEEHSIARNDLLDKIQAYAQVMLPEATPEQWLSYTFVPGVSGLVKSVTVSPGNDLAVTYDAYQFMSECLGIDSPNFTWTWRGDFLIIKTIGNGHGVGLSETGAAIYADPSRTKWDYLRIVTHYYPGVTIKALDWSTVISV